jgi:hypothetical protein
MRLNAGLVVVTLAGLSISAQSAFAGAFTIGNIVVSRINLETTTANSGAVFIDEFTVTGSPVQSVPLPTADSGGQFALTIGGTSTSAGFLTRSADGRFLTIGGTNAPNNTSSPNGNGSFQGRTVARIDAAGTVDTSTRFLAAGTTLRSVVSDNGTGLWLSSDTGSGTTGGLRYTTFGASTSGVIITTGAYPTNNRVNNIFNGQLYNSSGASVGTPSVSWRGVSAIGTGLPTAGNSAAPSLVVGGGANDAGPLDSAYDFYFANANTLYVCDDDSSGTLLTGGLSKFAFNGSSWVKIWTATLNGSIGFRSITGATDSSGNVQLYLINALTSTTGQTSLVALSDTVSGTSAGSFSVLATAATGQVFRGVEFAPVPTPSALGVMALAGLAAARRRRA